MRTRRLVVSFILFFTSQVFSAGPSPKKILQDVEKTLTEAGTFQADFVQDFLWKMTGEKQSLSGKISLMGEDRFFVETEDQIIISDGKTLWMYNKIANRVLIDKLINSDETLLPRQILLKHTDDYIGLVQREEKVEGEWCYLLHLTAHTEDTFIPIVKVWVQKNKWVPARIEQIDINDNITTYHLNNIVTGLPLDKKIFTFTMPEGAEVIDMR